LGNVLVPFFLSRFFQGRFDAAVPDRSSVEQERRREDHPGDGERGAEHAERAHRAANRPPGQFIQ
jgi:hypothetical protein